MPTDHPTRRTFIRHTGQAATVLAACGLARTISADTGPSHPDANEPHLNHAALLAKIKDPEIRAGLQAAIEKNLLPAAVETAYPGYFLITADGNAHAGLATWPGLDSWQMCGAYLLLGRTRLVLDYFDFVRAGQRKDGNIPWAVFPGEMQANTTCLRALKNPQDVFTYNPPKREGLASPAAQTPRKWIGLFEHWQTLGDPLTTLGPICYLLTAAEILDATHDAAWFRERLPSIENAAKYIWSRKSENGLIGGCGFYTEAPPRYAWDGVTQCYAVHAFRELARIMTELGDKTSAAAWTSRADEVAQTFGKLFWRDDHFGEYIHPEHGLVDAHGLSDVNWAVIAFDVATPEQVKLLQPRLLAEQGFWPGDTPTLTVTKPKSYKPWEQNPNQPCPVPPLNDVAAMGRAWYLEALACTRLNANDRLVESVKKVCHAGLPDGFWRERYHPTDDGKVVPAGAQKYCEYPAVLIRTVLNNQAVFT